MSAAPSKAQVGRRPRLPGELLELAKDRTWIYFFADDPSKAERITVPAASVLGFTRSNTGSEAYEVCWASARVSILPDSTMDCSMGGADGSASRTKLRVLSFSLISTPFNPTSSTSTPGGRLRTSTGTRPP